MKQDTPLDGIAAEARANELKRDTALLRATVDLFVLDGDHDKTDLLRFEELALHYLPKTAASDRQYVSERLSERPDAPHAVIITLARDEVEVAAPVILRSPVLSTVDLLAIIAAKGNGHCRIIARRPSLSAELAHALSLTGDPETIAVLDGAPAGNAAPAPSPAPAAPPRYRPGAPPALLDPWRFLGLDRRGRLAIIADLASRQATLAEVSASPDLAFRAILGAARIVGFAQSGQLPAIVETIVEGLDLPRDLVAAAVTDPGGELLAIMLKALRLTDDQARQVLLLASPTGKDVATFFPLSDVYAGLEVIVAEALVAAWRDATGVSRAPHHQPHFADPATARRPAAGTHAEPRRESSSDDKAERA